MSTAKTTLHKDCLRVYVGWDSREDIAWQVCRQSLLRNVSHPVQIRPLRQNALRAAGLYSRLNDPLSATEFTFTRFLVPYLAGYQGWALFCDCDFLWFGDVTDLFGLADDRFAVMCVHHDHRPLETVKMDGAKQVHYPRKNWSSMVLYNCGHPANRVLTPYVVNRESGAFLHRFQWLEEKLIGALPETWNWLEGWNKKPVNGRPEVVHYTRGGPWFPNWQNVDYAAEWMDEAARFEAQGGTDIWNILDFWQDELDGGAVDLSLGNVLKMKFGTLHARALLGATEHWRATPQGRVAEILLLADWGEAIAGNAEEARLGKLLASKLAVKAEPVLIRLPKAAQDIILRAARVDVVGTNHQWHGHKNYHR